MINHDLINLREFQILIDNESLLQKISNLTRRRQNDKKK